MPPASAVPVAESSQFSRSMRTPPSWRARTLSRNGAEASVPSKPSKSTWSASSRAVSRAASSATGPLVRAGSGAGAPAGSSSSERNRSSQRPAVAASTSTTAITRRRSTTLGLGPLGSPIAAAIVFSADNARDGGDEVRRHLGRHARRPQARRAPDRRRAGRAASRWSRCSRPAARPPTTWSPRRSRSPSTHSRARWTCCSRPGSGSRARCARWPFTTWATTRSRSPDRRLGSSPTPPTRRRGSSRSAAIASARA